MHNWNLTPLNKKRKKTLSRTYSAIFVEKCSKQKKVFSFFFFVGYIYLIYFQWNRKCSKITRKKKRSSIWSQKVHKYPQWFVILLHINLKLCIWGIRCYLEKFSFAKVCNIYFYRLLCKIFVSTLMKYIFSYQQVFYC